MTCGTLAQHTMKKATCCSFKPSRPMRIVTGGGEDSKCLFNAGPPFKRVTEGNPAESCHTRGSVHCVRYNKQGTMIASVGTDKSVSFYDGKTMQLINRVEGVHHSSIYSCAWNGNGDELLTCSADGTVKLMSANDFTILKTWDVASDDNKNNAGNKVPQGKMQMGCAFLQGATPVSVSLNGRISVLSRDNGNVKKSLSGHQSPISSMSLDYINGIMYTGDSDGVICMWDIKTGESIDNVQRGDSTEEGYNITCMNKVHKGAITGLTIGSNALLSIGWDDKIRFTESSSATRSVKLQSQPNQIKKGTEIIVIMTVNGLLLVRDNTIVSDLIELAYEPTSVCVSADDKRVYVGGKDNNIHIYSVENDSLSELRKLSGMHLQPIYALSLSNDGTKLASADVRDICVWNLDDDFKTVVGKGRWCFHNQKINALTWSYDDTILASGGNDDSIFCWSIKKPTKRIHYSFAHRGGVTGLEFLKNADGLILASVGNDGCVNQWDVTDDVMKKFG